MNAYEITDENFISEGQRRKIYAHPTDFDVCIKIPKAGLKNRSRDRELKYLRKYSKLSSSYLSAYLGNVVTNLGVGYKFHLIRDFDGSVSRPLSKLNQLDDIEEQIHALGLRCIKDRVVIGDLHHGNIVAQMLEDSSYRLWVIDGVGNSDFIKVCDFSECFMRKKIKRAFGRLAASLGFQLSWR